MLAVFFVLFSYGSLGLLSGCSSAPTEELLPTEIPTQEPAVTTIQPETLTTATASPNPLGSPDHPLILGLVSDTEQPAVLDNGNQMAEEISSRSELTIQARVFTSYEDLLAGMRAGDVHLAWLPPLTYIKAHQDNTADVVFLTYHFGVYQYNTLFFANSNQRFVSYFDENTNQSTADAQTALSQLQGLRPCWVDETSPSGYLVPAGILTQNQIPYAEGVITRDHVATIRALYITGICDYGAGFGGIGDPRTSSALSDLPDVMERVEILWQSDPIIPTLNLSIHPIVTEDMRSILTRAFSEYAQSEDGQQVLSSAARYEITGLREADDTTYDALRQIIASLNFNLDLAIGK